MSAENHELWPKLSCMALCNSLEPAGLSICRFKLKPGVPIRLRHRCISISLFEMGHTSAQNLRNLDPLKLFNGTPRGAGSTGAAGSAAPCPQATGSAGAALYPSENLILCV